MPWRPVRNSYPPVDILSADAIEAIHLAALDILERIGMAVQSESARELCRRAGAEIMPDGVRVRFDRGLIESARASAPASFPLKSRLGNRDTRMGEGSVVFGPVSGAPNCSDIVGGRRPGTTADYERFLKLCHVFNAIHLTSGYPVEPIDVPVPVRHLVAGRAMLTMTDKPARVYCHTLQRAEDTLEMNRIVHRVTREEFEQAPRCLTVINTNSPLQLDKPMVEGLVAMAQANQIAVVTPFTLAGAMAPVTLIGAIAQQNAEALAGIAITQFARPGAPVVYGGFTTNVNMRSGAPAFGTPEYAKAALISGQLARRYRVPFRSSHIATSNAPDTQSVYEGMMALWSAIMGGVNFLHQGAGWIEGGLTASFEKFVLDVEALQMFASFLTPEEVTADTLAMEAIAEVGPGGHFFATPHTLARYETAFYAPLVSDWRNHQTWAQDGAVDATARAHRIAMQAIEEYEPPQNDPAMLEELDAFIARRVAEGGAPVN